MNPFDADTTPIMYADGTAITWEDTIERLLIRSPWQHVIATTESSSTYANSGTSSHLIDSIYSAEIDSNKVAKMSWIDPKRELSFVNNMEKFVNELANER